MRILLLCGQPDALVNGGDVNNLSTIYAYYYNKWLQPFGDCEIFFDSAYLTTERAIELGEYDFCISLINRGYLGMKPATFRELRKKIKYQMITICATNKIIGKEDLLLFTMGKRKERAMRLYWGADFDLLKPNKPDRITILIDHKYYGKENTNIYQKDQTDKFIASALAYRASDPIANNIVIKHIGIGKVNEVDNDYQIEGFKQSTGMDFRQIYQHYNEAHIYVVTHPESFGLTVIECATAGALIVYPDGYIKSDIMKRLHHCKIKDMDNIDWSSIIAMVNVQRSIECAKFFSYEQAIGNLHTHLKHVHDAGEKQSLVIE